MCFRKTRGVKGTTTASVFVVLGMWLERYNIVVPTSQHPRTAMSVAHYLPSSVELSIMAATFAGFILVYMIATKFFPIISLWEIQEGREESVKEVSERVASYLPDNVEVARP
jgi:molybdopterin-containing oxidoreductase family membrane subunit